MRQTILSIIFALLVFSMSAQGGWTKQKGTYFAKLDFSRLAANTYYNLEGNALTTNTFTQNSINWYAEYGVSDRLTIVSSMPLLRVNAFETSDPVYGIGDLRLDFKYRLHPTFPISISVAPELPIGRSNAFSASKTDPLDRINLPTGDGEFNVWTTLAASGSIGKVYSSVFGAYNFRTKYKGLAFRDLYQLGFELGATPLKNLWVNTKVKAQYSTGESLHPELGFVRGDGTTYTLVSGELFYKITNHIGLSATYLTGGSFLAPFKNLYIAPYFSLGFIYEKK